MKTIHLILSPIIFLLPVSCSFFEDFLNGEDDNIEILENASKCSYIENFESGTDAYYFNNMAALFHISDFYLDDNEFVARSDEEHQDAWVYTVLNEKSKLYEKDSQIVIFLDNKQRLSCVSTEQEEYIFTNYHDNMCDILIVYNSGDYSVMNNFEMPSANNNNSLCVTKADIPLDAIKVLSGIQSAVEAAAAFVGNAPALTKLGAGLGYLGNITGGNVGSILQLEGNLLNMHQGATNSISQLYGSIRGLGLQFAAELWIRNREYMKENFGLVNIHIDDAITSNSGNVELYYTISGFIENPLYDFKKSISWTQVSDGWGDILSSKSYGCKWFNGGADNGYYHDNIDLGGISGLYRIQIFLSPEVSAWSPISFSESIVVEVEATERDALIKLFNESQGNTWKNNTNWCSTYPLDEWYGITTDSEGYVTSIVLDDNNLNAEFLTINLGDYSRLTSFSISNNNISSITIQGNSIVESITLDNCAKESIYVNEIPSVIISDCNNLSCINGYAAYLEVNNCNFGEHITPFDIEADEAIIRNCTMHSCGLNSNYLRFENSKTYNTWYCNTSKRFEIIDSYCSTICGGDFNDNTIIVLNNATLWRSNWDDKSLVTLSLTTTGKGWYSLWN